MHQTGWTTLVADLIIDPPRSSQRLIFAETSSANSDVPSMVETPAAKAPLDPV